MLLPSPSPAIAAQLHLEQCVEPFPPSCDKPKEARKRRAVRASSELQLKLSDFPAGCEACNPTQPAPSSPAFRHVSNALCSQVLLPRDIGDVWLPVQGSREGRIKLRLPDGSTELLSLHELRPWMQARQLKLSDIVRVPAVPAQSDFICPKVMLKLKPPVPAPAPKAVPAPAPVVRHEWPHGTPVWASLGGKGKYAPAIVGGYSGAAEATKPNLQRVRFLSLNEKRPIADVKPAHIKTWQAGLDEHREPRSRWTRELQEALEVVEAIQGARTAYASTLRMPQRSYPRGALEQSKHESKRQMHFLSGVLAAPGHANALQHVLAVLGDRSSPPLLPLLPPPPSGHIVPEHVKGRTYFLDTDRRSMRHNLCE